jgi:cell division septal protein FtsQ
MYKQKRRLGRFGVYVTPVLIILVLTLGFYLAIFKYEIFNISNTEVTGAQRYVSEIDLKELVKSRAYGKNLITFNTTKLKETLVNDFQGAHEISVVKKYPKTLKIIVNERQPTALVYGRDESLLYIVDSEGYVLGQVSPDVSDLPKIYYDGEIAVGYFLDRELMAVYMEVISAVDVEKISASSVSVYSDYLALYVDDAIEVFLGKNKNIESSIKILSGLLTQLKAEGKNAKRIDLRYDKVVVSYN